MLHFLADIAWAGAIILGFFFLIVWPVVGFISLRQKAEARRVNQQLQWGYIEPIHWGKVIGIVCLGLLVLVAGFGFR